MDYTFDVYNDEGVDVVSRYNELSDKVVCYNCGEPLAVKVVPGYVVYRCNYCGATVRREITE